VAGFYTKLTGEPNAFKQFSAPFDVGDAGIGPAVAATILTGTARTSRSVKSFRGGQHRKCAICLPSLALVCRNLMVAHNRNRCELHQAFICKQERGLSNASPVYFNFKPSTAGPGVRVAG
jgi:hypothetical protein